MLNTPLKNCFDAKSSDKEQIHDLKLIMYFSRNNNWFFLHNDIYQLELRHFVYYVWVDYGNGLQQEPVPHFRELGSYHQESHKYDISLNVQSCATTTEKDIACHFTNEDSQALSNTKLALNSLAQDYKEVEFSYGDSFKTFHLRVKNFDDAFARKLQLSDPNEQKTLIRDFQKVKETKFDNAIHSMFATACIAGDYLMLIALQEKFSEHASKLDLLKILNAMFRKQPFSELNKPFDKNPCDYGKVFDWLSFQGYDLKAHQNIFDAQQKQRNNLWFFQSAHACHTEMLSAAAKRNLYDPKSTSSITACTLL